MESNLMAALDALVREIDRAEGDEKIEAINTARLALHRISPFRAEPVDCVIWVKTDTVEGSDYNPNVVAAPEMRLLEHSIVMDGYTQPIVTYDTGDTYEVVDGFHRNRVSKESEQVRMRIEGYLPIVTINSDRTDRSDRMAATVRHNRARGKHVVSGMSDLVAELVKRNWSDAKIAKELGMEPDEVLRLKQVTGLTELFADRDFSMAWESVD